MPSFDRLRLFCHDASEPVAPVLDDIGDLALIDVNVRPLVCLVDHHPLEGLRLYRLQGRSEKFWVLSPNPEEDGVF